MKLTHLTIVVMSILCEVEGSLVKITNNRYDGLVIAISPHIKQDERIISNLKEYVTEASPYLYQATRNRSYIGDVKILVPDTWRVDTSWTQAKVETFEDADIRVDVPHPSYGDNPYTFQPGRCGDPGKYIHLTEHFVLDPQQNNFFTYGPSGRVLVHEFAHLRYGVFDEYGLGTDSFPNFYIDDSSVYPTGCTDSMRGHMYGNCSTMDPDTKLPGKDCYFLADTKQNTAKASVMYDVGVESVVSFCESNSNDPDMSHNSLAPNLQNKMCKKGTWDVIKDNKDFINGANPPAIKTPDELKPSFTVLYREKNTTETPGTTGAGSGSGHGAEICGRPVVLVLDVSGSMQSEQRIQKQRQASDQLIKDILPEGTQVGIVRFNNRAFTNLPLMSLNTPANRAYASGHIPTVADGGTSIGSGLRMATQMLVKAGAQNTGRIVLITDGEENAAPKIAQVMPEVERAGIRVHAIAYSSAADTHIRTLTQDTGGKYTYYSGHSTSTQLQSAMEEFKKDISVCTELDRIEITRKAVTYFGSRDAEGRVVIDSTLRNNTLFVFTLPTGRSTMVTLRGPDNTVYDAGSPQYSKEISLGIVRFRFDIAQAGVWHYILRSPKAGTAVVVVKALPTDTQSPYEVDSWMSSNLADLQSSHKVVIVYVHVHKGYSPVVDAKVSVDVERPSGAPVTLYPSDNGIGADTLADDGVYSSYFVEYSANARYSLDVMVESVYGKTAYVLFGNGSSVYGGSPSRYHNTTVPPTKVLSDNFTRTTSPGAMDVHGFKPGVDQIPPGEVIDLKIVTSDNKTRTVTLTWTAPGDDLNIGTAHRYDFRISKTGKELIDDFNKTKIVDPSRVTSGSLKPKPVGTKEEITIKAPDGWDTVAFAVKTMDEAGHVSHVSNIVSTSFKQVRMSSHLATPEPTTTPTTTRDTTTGEMVANRKDRSPETTKEESPTCSKQCQTNIALGVVGGVLSAGAVAGVSVVVWKQFHITKTSPENGKRLFSQLDPEKGNTQPPLQTTIIITVEGF